MIANGIFEVMMALLLAIGLFTRIAASLLVLHMLPIISSLGFTQLGVRDFGIAIGTLAIALHGADRLCLERHFRKPVPK